MAGCASSQGGYFHQAPVEDRGTAAAKKPAIGPDVLAKTTNQAKPLGHENEGKPGYYTVKQGDTLIRVGLDHGHNWRDIARWNQIDRPSQIEVGQVLRVDPPSVATSARPLPATVVVTPVPVPGAAPIAVAAPSTMTKPASDDFVWMWPTASTTLLAGFDESKNKGLDIGGKAGDAVLATADGKVVYAGSGLRGYGNLIILKHNETFLSAYAHNQILLVKEDQTVTRGQKIAEMGQSDSDKVKLHFEIRKQGKPVDPAQYLPRR